MCACVHVCVNLLFVQTDESILCINEWWLEYIPTVGFGSMSNHYIIVCGCTCFCPTESICEWVCLFVFRE